MRNEDIRCRWGRDEFVLLLPGQSQESAARAVERLLLELASRRVQASEVEALSISCSVGIATFPADGLTGGALIHAAEMRLCERRAAAAAVLLLTEPQPTESP